MRICISFLLVMFVAGCQGDDESAGSDRSAATLKAQALSIAKAIAKARGTTVDKKCLGTEAIGHLEGISGDDVQSFNAPFGEFDGECDPHFSVDLYFSAEGDFLAAKVIDS